MVWKGFHSGGASYVLSRESLRRFKQAHDDPNSNCRRDGGNEDVEIAKCLRTKGVFPGTARDDKNRELFHPLPFTYHFSGAFPEWLVIFSENPPESVSLLKKLFSYLSMYFFLFRVSIVVVIKQYHFIMFILKSNI